MVIDIEKRRRDLLDYVVAIYQKVSYEDAFRDGTMGNYGTSTLEAAIECIVVGLFAEGRELLQKAHTLLRVAVERDERFDGGQNYLRQQYVLASWLLKQRVRPKVLKDAVAWSEARFEQPPRPDKTQVQLELVTYLEAGEYETLIRRFDTTGIAKPKDIRRIRGEGTMCYVLARHRLGLEYEPEEIAAALETFLKRSIKDWLGHLGAFSTTAQWLKIAHCKPGDDPIAVTLRAYDYLPDLVPPQYPTT